jgi:hypothetical protein
LYFLAGNSHDHHHQYPTEEVVGALALAKSHTENHLQGDKDVNGQEKGATHIDLSLCHGHDPQCDRGLILDLARPLDEVAVVPKAPDSAAGGALVTAAMVTAVVVTKVGVQ